MKVYDVVRSRRTIRRFKQDRVERELLIKLVDAARLAPSAKNLQPCEYVVVDEPSLLPRVFETLSWAGYIAPRGNPPPGETPTAYVVVLLNREKRKAGGEHDAGAAIENMLLVAQENGVGSCCLGSVDRPKLRSALGIPERCEIDSVIALGYPNEHPVVEEFKDSIKYWKDNEGVLHVPKRKLDDVLHLNRY